MVRTISHGVYPTSSFNTYQSPYTSTDINEREDPSLSRKKSHTTRQEVNAPPTRFLPRLQNASPLHVSQTSPPRPHRGGPLLDRRGGCKIQGLQEDEEQEEEGVQEAWEEKAGKVSVTAAPVPTASLLAFAFAFAFVIPASVATVVPLSHQL